MVMVRYQIDNKSHDTLWVAGSFLNPNRSWDQSDSLYVVQPNSRQVVMTKSKVCWFGDCRVHLRNDVSLDTLKVYNEALNLEPIEISRTDWKLRKTRAVLKVSK
mgnify:FL=1